MLTTKVFSYNIWFLVVVSSHEVFLTIFAIVSTGGATIQLVLVVIGTGTRSSAGNTLISYLCSSHYHD